MEPAARSKNPILVFFLFSPQSEDDASHADLLGGFGRRLPEASLKSGFGHKKS